MTREKKHRFLMSILTKRGIDREQRHELAYQWSEGRSWSTRDLKDGELDELLNYFQDKSKEELLLEKKLKEKRSTVLAIATRTGIHNPRSWNKFNNWMLKSSIHHKSLNKYSLEEIDALIRQFRALEANYNKSASTPHTKAYNHKVGFQNIVEN